MTWMVTTTFSYVVNHYADIFILIRVVLKALIHAWSTLLCEVGSLFMQSSGSTGPVASRSEPLLRSLVKQKKFNTIRRELYSTTSHYRILLSSGADKDSKPAELCTQTYTTIYGTSYLQARKISHI